MKSLSFLLILLSLSFYAAKAFAQSENRGEISGKIVSNDGTPGAFATVTLLRASDSALVKGAISDEDGKYQFIHVPYGKYLIAVSVIGMDKAYSSAFSLNADHHETTLRVITLEPNTKLLKGVEVSAAKPFIQHKPGQTIVNV